MTRRHTLEASFRLTEKEATTLFAYHMQMAILFFEICPEDVTNRLAAHPASENLELNQAIIDFVNRLATIYDAWEKK